MSCVDNGQGIMLNYNLQLSSPYLRHIMVASIVQKTTKYNFYYKQIYKLLQKQMSLHTRLKDVILNSIVLRNAQKRIHCVFYLY